MTGGPALLGDERGVSVTVSHALSIGITTILLSGLLVGAGAFVESNEQRVADNQLSEIGHSVASQVTTLDQLNATGEDVETTVDLQYPRAIAGSSSYTIELTEDSVIVESDELERRFVVSLEDTDTELGASEARPPDVRVSLCDDENEITFGGCD